MQRWKLPLLIGVTLGLAGLALATWNQPPVPVEAKDFGVEGFDLPPPEASELPIISDHSEVIDGTEPYAEDTLETTAEDINEF